MLWTVRAQRAAVVGLTRNSPAASRTDSPAAIAALPAAAISARVPRTGRPGTRGLGSRPPRRPTRRRANSIRRSCSVIPPAIPSG